VKLGRRALRAHPLPPVIDGGKETKGRDLRDLDIDGHTFAATGV